MFFQLISEAVKMAFLELWNNRLRTFLSLVGITIGIFCIISVFTVIDTFEDRINNTISRLGSNVLYIAQFPWESGPNYEWWEFVKRPLPNLSDYEALKKSANSAESVCFAQSIEAKEVNFRNSKIKNIGIFAATHDWDDIWQLQIENGRYFTDRESHLGEPVAILGAKIVEDLFTRVPDPIGAELKIDGRKYKVIGQLEMEGQNLMGNGFDEAILIPLNNLRKFRSLSTIKNEPLLNIKPKENVSVDQLKAEVVQVLRAHHRLKPKEKDDFSINQISMLSTVIESVFGVINWAGIFIGGFSILVGGFGIANIMFVSVRERTKLIGIKKSLGAKRWSILSEFLVEAIILCLIGGLVGLFSVYVLTEVAQYFNEDLSFPITTHNIYIGVVTSIVIGVVSGIIPAIIAAWMNPVDAIRAK